MTVFGPLLTGTQVTTWVKEILNKWFSSYLAEVERQDGVTPGEYPRPASLNQRIDTDNWPEDHLPALIVVIPGTQSVEKRAGGEHMVVYRVTIASVVSARDEDAVWELAYAYQAALRGCLIQHQSLEGHAERIDWVDESIVDTGQDSERTLMITESTFDVAVPNVVLQGKGPITPDPNEDPLEPYPDYPEVSETDVDFTAKTIGDN